MPSPAINPAAVTFPVESKLVAMVTMPVDLAIVIASISLLPSESEALCVPIFKTLLEPSNLINPPRKSVPSISLIAGVPPCGIEASVILGLRLSTAMPSLAVTCENCAELPDVVTFFQLGI